MERKKDEYTPMGDDFCPTCNYKIEVAVALVGEHQAPNPHDVNICLNCGEHLEYADDMALIILTEKTKKQLTENDLYLLDKGSKFIKKRGFIKR